MTARGSVTSISNSLAVANLSPLTFLRCLRALTISPVKVVVRTMLVMLNVRDAMVIPHLTVGANRTFTKIAGVMTAATIVTTGVLVTVVMI